MKIRVATPADAERIAEIYGPYVENTAITFEYKAPDASEMAKRIAKTLETYPYLVSEDDDGIVRGYTYAGRFRVREAYDHCVEMSLYVDIDYRKSGIGRALYAEIEKLLLMQNIYVVYANVTFTNDKEDTHVTDDSIKFHKKLGYELIGKHADCGYKFGNWYGVCWLEKNLSERPEVVEPFIPFPRIKEKL